MARMERDEEREHRISDEAIVDAYGAEEQALGWYYYLDDRIQFPFEARCIAEKRLSPLRVGEKVRALRMVPVGDCAHGMYVEVEWAGRTFGVPLDQLEPSDVDEQAREAIADWRYWVGRGYEFG